MANASSWLGCLVVGSEAGRRAMEGSSGTRVRKGQGLGPFPIGLAAGRPLPGSQAPSPQTTQPSHSRRSAATPLVAEAASRHFVGFTTLSGRQQLVYEHAWWRLSNESSLGLSVQASEGWADLPATTRPPQRVQPEAAGARVATGRDRQSGPAGVPV